ncbi:MAG: AsmA family protein [Sneathiella sp.]|nr:AsmA family protein [Sneathiella sp.]
MKKVVYGILGILVLVVAIAIALPFLIPAERIKEELILVANDATGRTLSIDGEFGISFFPVLGLQASDVSFSNAPSSDEPNMATIKNLTVALNILPLLSGEIQVDKFILDTPRIYLETTKDGKNNWDFPKTQEASNATSSSESDDAQSAASDMGIRELNLGDIQILNGFLTFNDLKAGSKQEISDINLSVILKGLDQPFRTNGSAVWNKEKIELNTEITNLKAVLDNTETPIKASIKSTKISLVYDGKLTTTSPLSLGGKTTLSIPSIKDLTVWIGQPLEAQEGTFELLNITGDVSVTGSRYAFKNAELTFDKITGTGDIAADLSGKVPSIIGKLALPTLDVNPYLPEENAEKSATSEQKVTKPSKEKWDSTPMDFAALKSVNATFDLTIDNILIKKIKIGKSNVGTTLKDGLLKINLTELNLYDGKAQGSVVLDARKKIPKISKSFTLTGVQLNPLLTDAADFKKLEGTGMIQLEIKATGISQKDMVNTLAGKGKILFENGAIKGVNLASMARNVTSAFTDDGTEQKTDFAELSGTYTITKGILKNTDLKMLNPFIRLSGAGTVNMPNKTLKYRIEPKLVSNAKGQGGESSTGITVPVLISGSWENPKFAPDLAGVLSNIAKPENLKKNLENIGKTGKQELENILKGGLGGLFGKKK